MEFVLQICFLFCKQVHFESFFFFKDSTCKEYHTVFPFLCLCVGHFLSRHSFFMEQIVCSLNRPSCLLWKHSTKEPSFWDWCLWLAGVSNRWIFPDKSERLLLCSNPWTVRWTLMMIVDEIFWWSPYCLLIFEETTWSTELVYSENSVNHLIIWSVPK